MQPIELRLWDKKILIYYIIQLSLKFLYNSAEENNITLLLNKKIINLLYYIIKFKFLYNLIEENLFIEYQCKLFYSIGIFSIFFNFLQSLCDLLGLDWISICLELFINYYHHGHMIL
jgi:hypothetical protein